MRLRRTLAVGLLVGASAIPITADAAGAVTRNVSGTLTGPGGFRSEGCNGIISEVGSGTYTTTGLGSGTYAFDVCITSSPLAFAGTMTFTRRTGATLHGTIVGTVESGSGPLFTVTVTGGTRRYANARGTLMVGPLVESSPHNCDPRVGICLDWTDTGPIVGRLTHVRRHG
jgi:hypothetical protein